MLEKLDPSLPVTLQSWPDALALVFAGFQRGGTVALASWVCWLACSRRQASSHGQLRGGAATARDGHPRGAGRGSELQVLRAALGRTVLLLGIGSVAGLVLGALGTRVLASIVYQATVYDPVVLAGAIAAMVLIGTIGRSGSCAQSCERGAGDSAAG